MTIATAVAGVLGGLLAAALLALDGVLGLRGWQWVFLGRGVGGKRWRRHPGLAELAPSLAAQPTCPPRPGEGVPTVIFALLTPLLLPRSPKTARFLTPAERTWLLGRAAAAADDGGGGGGGTAAAAGSATMDDSDRTRLASARSDGGDGASGGGADRGWRHPAVRAVRDWRTWYFSLVWATSNVQYYVCRNAAGLERRTTWRAGCDASRHGSFRPAGQGIMFWMPLLLAALNPSASPPEVALLTAIPYACASAAMLANAAHAKRAQGRRLHVALPLICGGASRHAPHAPPSASTAGHA